MWATKHHHDQHDAVQHVLEVEEVNLTQDWNREVAHERIELLEQDALEEIDDKGTRGNTDRIPHAAKHDCSKRADGYDKAELVRSDNGDLGGVDHADDARNRGPHSERLELCDHGIDAG